MAPFGATRGAACPANKTTMEKTKTPSQSATETRFILAPHQVNAKNSAFGGIIMSWIDMTAGMVAERHCEGLAVTASIDTLSFVAPIYIGDHVIFKASVNYVGDTSMEVGVVVTKENPRTGEQAKATKAYLTFVHIDANGKPTHVPRLKPETSDEKRRYENAAHRVASRKALLKKLR